MKKPGKTGEGASRSIDRRHFLKSVGAAAGIAAVGRLSDKEKSGIVPANESSGVTAVILGSAQDGGIPQAGCRCPHCEAARSEAGLSRRSPCLALLHRGERKAFLIDAGPDLPGQLVDLPRGWSGGVERNPVAGILLSHAHIGHYAGLVHLGREVLNTSGIPVYCSGQMTTFLRENGPWSLLVKLGNIELRTITANVPFSLASDLKIEPFSVPHRAEFTDTLFFIVAGPKRRLLYLTDIDRWQGLQPPIEELIKGVDIAILDGTFYSPEELPGRDMSKIPHPPVTETVERLGAIAAKGNTQIFFTHLNHSNLLLDADGRKLGELRGRGFDIVHDGMSFEL